ncbi:hypothetical protein F5Y09DRAFT_239934 [Xylaria sp. FL1042]|nr:hypothetical protein F5Y09DRAFT_239934 [Xylaria sp. FL1042]
MKDSHGWATACPVVLVSLFFVLYPLASKIRRRNQETRPEARTHRVVGVYGLGAHPEHTWTCEEPTAEDSSRTKAHLLRDLLASSFPEARILSFAHSSDWLVNAPIKTAEEIGERLLEQLVKHRNNRKQHLPIIFIGHSLGGIIIK